MLNRHVLLDTIRVVQERGESGTLKLERDSESVTIYFLDGLIGAISSSNAELRLGRFLARRGILNGNGIGPLLAEARRKHAPLGETAVARRLLDAAELTDVVQEQAVQALTYALQNEFDLGSFERRPFVFNFPARLDFDRLRLELSRVYLRPVRLEPHEWVVLRDGAEISHLPWYPTELAVLSALHEPRTLQELAVVTGQEYSSLNKILGVLLDLQLVARVTVSSSETTAIVKREAFPYESLIPEISRNELNERLTASIDETTFVAEQFRNLKVRIQELGASRPVRLITVSSPDPEAGKSFISTNLALSLSREPGRRILLVDADLRNPGVHKYLGTTLEPGLLGFLENDYLQPYCYMRRLNRLFVLTAGGTSLNPVETLSQDKMHRLAHYLQQTFDMVIFDAPPMVPISDAQVLASLCDGLIVVARSGRTTYGSLESALKVVDRKKLLGLVLNDVQPRLFHTHFDHRYYNHRYRGHYPYAPTRPRTKRKSYLDL